jgi:hypothetical protein
MDNGDTFSDPTLKQSLVREAERIEVNPSLLASVEGLFADAADQDSPAPLPLFRNRFLLMAAALVVAGLSIAFFILRDKESDWDKEYTISEARLWPAMAGLYRSESAATNPSTLALGDGPVLADPRYKLVGAREDKLETVPCVVRDYRRDDGTTLSVITTPAANLLRESHHEEEEADERYDERVGSIRIVGGINDEYWICVAAPAATPDEVFNDVLKSLTTATK